MSDGTSSGGPRNKKLTSPQLAEARHPSIFPLPRR